MGRAGKTPKADKDMDERYRELEEFCENDPMMREVEEQAAREIEKESRRLESPKGDESGDVYIEPTHKEKQARATRARKSGRAGSAAAGRKAPQVEEPQPENKKKRGMKPPGKPAPVDDAAAEALSSYPWHLEKATRYAKDEDDDELLGMLESVDKGMREEDYVSLVMLMGEIECRYEADPPEDLKGILQCIGIYVAGLKT
jgi:hypothetical protein